MIEFWELYTLVNVDAKVCFNFRWFHNHYNWSALWHTYVGTDTESQSCPAKCPAHLGSHTAGRAAAPQQADSGGGACRQSSVTVNRNQENGHWWLMAGFPALVSLRRRQRWAAKCGSAQLDSWWRTALTFHIGVCICAPESILSSYWSTLRNMS